MRSQIILKRNKEESLLRFHPWIFSGAIQQITGDPAEGDIVDVITSSREFIARGHYQIGSIAVRVLTFREETIDAAWWAGRLRAALEVRAAVGLAGSTETTCYRLVHGEGDNLPGLIIDIYGNTAVMQCHSVGMYCNREEICAALREVFGDTLTAVYDKSSHTVPYNANLGAADGYLCGSKGDDTTEYGNVTVLENGHKFTVDWEGGQKTGFFLDQRENRELVGRYANGRTVLNTFCYTGGFSVYALAGGALKVDSVDSSQPAVDMCNRNAEINFTDGVPHSGFARDAFDYLRNMGHGEYDMIILDPPAFAKHHKVVGNALQGYKRLNAAAMHKIAPGGILFTFSCSQAVSKEQFRMAVFSAAAISGRNVRILHQLTQPADHPVNIYHPEGEYLKGLVLYIE